MILYAARHGETEFNRQGRIMGSSSNAPLTKNGIAQAQALRQQLADISFDSIYTSPLKRAVDTAEILFYPRYRPIPEPRLQEIGLGGMEGLTWEEAYRRYPDAAALMDNPAAYVPAPGGEPLTAGIARMHSFLTELTHSGKKQVFLLTHGYLLKILYACTVDACVSTIGDAPLCRNCQLVRYRYENRHWALLPEAHAK